MNKVILSNSSHPLYEKFKKLEGFIDYNDFNNQPCEMLFDFTALDTNNKKELFSKLSCPIVSDLSLNFGYSLFEEFPHLSSAVATVFPSPNSSCEVYYKDQEVKTELLEILNKLQIRPIEVSCSGIGFIFGRTIAQIMNEAWFALEDNLASEEAIDTAMLFGVNYPKGPIQWSKQAGLSNVVTLLEELYNVTKQDRYKVCQKLKEASL